VLQNVGIFLPYIMAVTTAGIDSDKTRKRGGAQRVARPACLLTYTQAMLPPPSQ